MSGLADYQNPGGTDPLSNTAAFTYDFLGRLTGAVGPNLPYGATADCSNGYCYDALGNMTQKESRTFYYSDATRPHRVMAMWDGAALTTFSHDANGNRTGKQSQAQTYAYDGDDRLGG